MAVDYISNGGSSVFREAVEFLRGKVALDKDEYGKLEDECRARAFTVSGYSSAEVLNTFLETLTRACEEGTTKEAFLKDMNTFLSDNGYESLNPWRSQIIFRTNMQTAMNAGHYESMTDPMTRKLRPYWQYKTAGDSGVRHDHAAMHDRVYAADDPIWDIWYPPNGFGCRCMVVSLSRKQFERMGVQLSTRPPFRTDEKAGRVEFIRPDKGFANNPAKDAWKPDLSGFRKDIRRVLERSGRLDAQNAPD